MDRKRKTIWIVIWISVMIICIPLILPTQKKVNKKSLSLSLVKQYQDSSLQKLPPVQEPLQWGRDPFVLGQETLTGGYRLTGIILDENNGKESYAIIDKQLVKVGDKINDSMILKIGKNYVTMEKVNGEKEDLFLNQ